MIHKKDELKASALRLLEELPGIADVVWGTVTRLASEAPPTCVLFTAVERNAGTSVLAGATALGLAQHLRAPVCLIETNVERPAVARYLGLRSAGLSDVLDGKAELDDCLQQPQDCPGLHVLTAGTRRARVMGELATDRWTALLAELQQRCDYLVLDAAPVLEQVETRLLLGHADALVLVLRARATLRKDAERAHDILVESGVPLLGSIFNAYKSEGLARGSGRTESLFQEAVQAERLRPRALPPVPREADALIGHVTPAPAQVELPVATNGDMVFKPNGPADAAVGPGEGRQIDILERRVAKLTQLLAQTEAELVRIAAMKNLDLGIASIYREVQGLSSEDEARATKKSLMKKIFEANLELKTAKARHS